MRINASKGNGNYKIHLNQKELYAFTIAIANLSVPDMEDEAEEQGLNKKEISYAHLELFEQLSAITGLYPAKTLDNNDVALIDKTTGVEVFVGESLEINSKEVN